MGLSRLLSGLLVLMFLTCSWRMPHAKQETAANTAALSSKGRGGVSLRSPINHLFAFSQPQTTKQLGALGNWFPIKIKRTAYRFFPENRVVLPSHIKAP